MKEQAAILARNLAELMRMRGDMKPPQLARESGVSARQIHYILRGERVTSIEIVDDLARPFGLRGYHLLMPDFRPDVIKNGRFDRLYHAYVSTDDDGRKVMETTADYVTKHPTANDPKGGAPEKRAGST